MRTRRKILKPATEINPLLAEICLLCCAVDLEEDGEAKTYMQDALRTVGIDLRPAKHKIFISGPMTGYVGHNYSCFDKVESLLRTAGYRCVNPANIGRRYNPARVDTDKKRYKAMTEEIQAAEKGCNTILLLPGWEKSRGVRLELKTAIDKDMKIVLWKD